MRKLNMFISPSRVLKFLRHIVFVLSKLVDPHFAQFNRSFAVGRFDLRADLSMYILYRQ